MKQRTNKQNTNGIILIGSEESNAEFEHERDKFEREALEGKATWGAWRYNPDNFTLEFDPKISHYPKDNPYDVDLERCNSATEIIGWLCHLAGKRWCPPEQIGYFFRAIYDLAGGPAATTLFMSSKRFNMRKLLEQLGQKEKRTYFKVQEVAGMLRIGKATVYRMVREGKLEAVRLPLGKEGELRIPKKEIDRILNA